MPLEAMQVVSIDDTVGAQGAALAHSASIEKGCPVVFCGVWKTEHFSN